MDMAKYIIQLILILFGFFAASRAKKQYRRALALKIVDWGIYKLDPLTGEKAVRLAKSGIVWANICSWGLVLVLLIYDLLDWIR